MKIFRANSSQRGFTLIELMIAMLIGVFLMAGVIQIFISAKQAYRLQENLSRLQENGRFAMDILTKDVRMAGFSGCASKLTPVVIATPASTKPNPANISAILTAINGINNVATNNWNTIACGTDNQCVKETDVVSFQSASSCGGQLTLASTATDIKIASPNTCGIKHLDVLLVANCTNAHFFVATNPNPATAIATGTQTIGHDALGTTTYGTDAEIFNAKLVSYYIRTGTGGVPSLYRIDNTKAATDNPTEELIEGIENMQILYGVDTDAAPDYVPNYYVPASSIPTTVGTVVADWTRVVSVRINLLAVTIENNLTDEPQPYFYNGTTVTKADLSATGTKAISVVKTDTSQLCPPAGTNCQLVDDRRIHRVFSSTIAVRNRLI